MVEVKATGREVDSCRWIPARITKGDPRAADRADMTSDLAVWQERSNCSGLSA
jgi:hypothetical protein